ncbi:dihydrolipoyl dehydrogenase [Candidatus Woesearchaeota archaeon]|nr:dihydrolipoyl dehydrogenase [Candidatus Woesearchaeota archaeon]
MVKDKVQQFDLLIIGSGSGLNVIPDGWKVAVVEKGKLGGTCLNRGCIPSKILIHSADVAETIKNAKKFGLDAKLNKVDFAKIISNASKHVDNSSAKIEKGLMNSKDITLFKGTAKFIDNRTVKVGNNIIKADKIIIAAGARPSIPNIPGLNKVKYMTSTEALRLKNQPKTLTILGGGYIACELAHFFGSLGTKINIVQRSNVLLSREDEEISKKFTEIFSKKYNVILNADIIKVYQKGKKKYVDVKTKSGRKTLISDEILVAMGVTSNADTLNLQKTGVKLNKNGFVETNDYLETTAKNIWALGDITGKKMLKHSANYDSQIVFENAIAGKKVKTNYSAMPHAIFSSPQIAGVGLTEQELKEKNIDYAVGKYDFIKTGMGLALQDEEGFVKIMVNPRTKKILGCHIVGTNASILIHEIVVAMQNNLDVDSIANTIHIHPALNEVIQRAIGNI